MPSCFRGEKEATTYLVMFPKSINIHTKECFDIKELSVKGHEQWTHMCYNNIRTYLLNDCLFTVTPVITLFISGLKSRVLILSFLSLKMMVKSGLEFILKLTEPLQSCCCPVQKFLPRMAELTWQLSRYLWRGSVNFKINSRPIFTVIFKPKNDDFMTRDFSPLIEWVLTGVALITSDFYTSIQDLVGYYLVVHQCYPHLHKLEGEVVLQRFVCNWEKKYKSLIKCENFNYFNEGFLMENKIFVSIHIWRQIIR